MSNVMRKVTIEEMFFMLDGVYKYNAMLWSSLDGINWYHAGFGRYCKTLEEAEQYRKENET